MGEHDSLRRKWLRLCLPRKWTLLEDGKCLAGLTATELGSKLSLTAF